MKGIAPAVGQVCNQWSGKIYIKHNVEKIYEIENIAEARLTIIK